MISNPNAFASLGATMFASASLGAGATTILAPGSNVRGVILRKLVMNANGAGSMALYEATSAPVSVVDATRDLLDYCTGAETARLRSSLIIPTGRGLYVYAPATAWINCTWDAL